VKNLPLVINIQDIYPDAAIELGKLPSSGPIPGLLKGLDSIIARKAAVLVTLSENFAQFYSTTRKVPADKVKVVYNWMDEEEIKPSHRMGKFRKAQGISEDSFVVMYSGNIGLNAGVEFIIEAAAKLQYLRNVIFVIAGDGSCRSKCEALAERYGLSNVRFFYPLPKEEVSDVQAAADLMLLPTRKSGALTSVPSKLVAYMLSGRPVLAAVADNSDTTRIIQQAECGVCVQPEDPDSLAELIRELIETPEELSLMGTKARSYAEQNFSRRTCVPKLISILESVASC
jgi:glycosyltransferase involved in cell wall biosynthesis